MQKTYNILVKAATAVLAMILAAGCVFEKEDPAGFDKKKDVMVLLDIKTSEMETKADVIYSDPTEAEKNLSTVRIYAFDSSTDKMIGYADNKSATDGVFHMLLRVPSDAAEITADFYVVANEGAMYKESKPVALVENMSKSELEAIVFNSLTPNTTDIPMYGILEGKKLNLTAGTPHYTEIAGHAPGFKLTESVNVELTRSLAKIEVYAAEAAAETTGKEATTTTSVTITGVSLANVPASGNLFTAPAASAILTYTDFNGTAEGTGSTSFLKAETVSVSKKVKQDALDAIKDPANYTLVSNAYYLAENNQGDEATYDFGATDYTTQATVLKIDYKVGGTDKTGYVKMPQIKRNTWYKVLARIKANGEIKLTLQVLPWTEGNGTTVNFTDQPSFDSSYGLQWNGVKLEGTNEYMLDTPAGSSVTCTFNITAPVGGKWYATLTDGDIQNYEIIGGTEGTDKASGNINGLATFTIKTKNSNFESPSLRDVKLVITAVDKNGRSMVLDFNEQGFFIVKQDNN